uniref:hypothetical protein n=1 Tax=Kitasatospora indigofera TaxID=67307 RepID=UPI002F90A307
MAKKSFSVKGVDAQAVAVGLEPRSSKSGAVAVRDAVRLPRQFDPAALGTEPADRLARLESIIEDARLDAAETVKAAKTRFEMQSGMALELIRKESLFLQAGESSFSAYVKNRWGYSLSRAYQFMDTVLVMGAVSTIVESPPPESQLRVLAVVVRQHGDEAARQVLAGAQALPGKVTAKTLVAVRDGLKLGPATEAGDDDQGEEVLDAELVGEPSAEVRNVLDGLAALARASQLLTAKNLTAALQHDPDLAEAVLAGYEHSGDVRRRLRRQSDAATR